MEYLPSLLVQTADLLHASCGSISWSCIGAGIHLCLSLLKKILPAHEAEEWAGSYDAGESIGSSGEFTGEQSSPPVSLLDNPPALVSSSQHQKQLLELAAVAVQQLLAKLLNPGLFRTARSNLLDQATDVLCPKDAREKLPSLEDMLDGCLSASEAPVKETIFPTPQSAISNNQYDRHPGNVSFEQATFNFLQTFIRQVLDFEK